MNLINLIVWLSTGAAVGWFANRMVGAEPRHTHISLPGKVCSS